MKTNIKQYLICKGTKKELEELIKWAESEIREWQSFLKELKSKGKDLTKKK